MRRGGGLMLALAAIAPIVHGVPPLATGILLFGGSVVTLASYARPRVRRRTRGTTDPFGNPAPAPLSNREPTRVSRPS